jgi:NAD(P)H-dependent FMN reductase
VAAIVGSIREGRLGPVVAGWCAAQAAQRSDMVLDLIDLAEAPLPPVLPAFGQPPAADAIAQLRAISPRLDAADAFVVITPEYNHSYPASLKHAIDWHHAQWHAKPVGFVSYGGISGGLRAVEHLRLVFAELHAVTIRETVSFANAGAQFADGAPRDPGAAAALQRMLEQLAWFAHALREARERRPYAA